MPKVQTRAGLVDYTEHGDGRPLVLLHATLHDRGDYEPIREALARTHRVIAVDWPGHGASEAPPEVTAPLLADTLEDIVRELDLRDVRLIGNSVGGFAAARLAITHPDRVAALVLVDSGGFGASNPLTKAFCRLMGTPAVTRRIMPRFVGAYMHPRTRSDEAIVERVQRRARTSEGIAVAASLWRSFATPDHDLRARAGELTAPTLIIWGRRDKALPLSVGKQTHKALTQARLEVLDTGHVVFSSDPDGFLALVEPFLHGIPLAAAPAGAS